MSKKGLPYFSVERQGRKHLNTLLDGQRYDLEEGDVDDLSPRLLEQEGLFYETDGAPASVKGDIESTEASSVENGGAFLEEELSEQEVFWAYALEGPEGFEGGLAAYVDTEDPNIHRERGQRYVLPSSLVHVFDSVKDSDQTDIYVERHDQQSVHQLHR